MYSSRVLVAVWIATLVVLLGIMPTGIAQAYLDPGSGSLIVQIVIAGILGLLVALKMYWGRVIGFFSGRKPEAELENTESTEIAGDEPR